MGALDGKHIRLHAPENAGSAYWNYKSYHSLVLLALVDANLEFIYVDVGHCGRAADGGIWRECSLKKGIASGSMPLPDAAPLPGTSTSCPYVIVGDGAFPLGTHLQRPFCRRNLTEREKIFNYRLSRARRVSENAFGVMANRFRVLLTAMYLKPDTATDVVECCCILHNFLRRRLGKNYIRPRVEADGTERIDETCPLQPLNPARGRKPSLKGKNVQNTLADYFMGPGQVSWQRKSALKPW